MTPISIQSWHRQISHLRYQNSLQILKAVDGIEVNNLIPAKIYGDCMKEK